MKPVEFFPRECRYDDVVMAIWQKLDKKGITIKAEVDGAIYPAPFTSYKNCHKWVILSDGSAILWNESPRNGYGFKHVGVTAVKNFYSKHIATTPLEYVEMVASENYDRFKVGDRVRLVTEYGTVIGERVVNDMTAGRVTIDGEEYCSRSGHSIPKEGTNSSFHHYNKIIKIS